MTTLPQEICCTKENGTMCKKCTTCMRFIATRAVTQHHEKRVQYQKNGFAGYLCSYVKTLSLSFVGRLLGFDSKSYAYIQDTENYNSMKQDLKELRIELSKFYYSSKTPSKMRLSIKDLKENKIQVGNLYAYEPKPKIFLRAQIIYISSDSVVILVANLDNGRIYSLVDVTQLQKPIAAIFFKLPFQVIRCKLFNLEVFLGSGSIETVWKMMYNKKGRTPFDQYRMTIINTNSCVPSVMILLNDSTNQSLNFELKVELEKFTPFLDSCNKMDIINNGKISTIGQYPIEYFPNTLNFDSPSFALNPEKFV